MPVNIENLTDPTEDVSFTFNGSRELLTVNYKGDTYFYVTNIRGDVEAIVDEDGNEVASYSYDPWGVPTITGTLSLPNPFLYQGAYGNIWDEEIELYWMNARHYDPSISRFITQDRSHGTLTNTMSQNLYIYCYNSPFDYNDPSGNRIWLPGVGTVPLKSELTTEQREMYDKAKEENPNLGIYTFMQMWNEAEDISDKMRKYKKGSNGEDYNKYDFEFAFWTCFWNDKAKIGLSSDDKLEFANQMKAISYFESKVGYQSGFTDDGLMQVESLSLLTAKNKKEGVQDEYKTWIAVDDNGNAKIGNRDYKAEDYDVNGDIMAGIAFFLLTAGGKHGDLSNPEVDKYGNSGTLNGFIHNHDSRSVVMNNIESVTGAYGGGNTYDAVWFRNHGRKDLTYWNSNGYWSVDKSKNWESEYRGMGSSCISTPYGDAVTSLARTGKYKGVCGQEVDLTIP